MPMYLRPYRLFSRITSNSLQSFLVRIAEQVEGQGFLLAELRRAI